PLVVVRDGTERTLSVKLDEARLDRTARGDRRGGEPDSEDKSALGVTLAPNDKGKGLVVQDVNPDGRAADAGIQPGDVIEQVNRQSVASVDDIRSALRRNADKPVLLLINRQGSEVFVTVRPSNG